MSLCRVFSCVVGRGCLLWPMCSLGKTLLAFALFCTPRPNLPWVTPGISWLSTFAFQSLIMKVKSESESHSVVPNSLQPHELYTPWNSPGQNTGVDSLSLLQGIFLTQGSNPGLPYCRRILYQLSPKGSPRILEWAAYSFSSRSSWPRNWTRVSCIAGGLLTNWATRDLSSYQKGQPKVWPVFSYFILVDWWVS